MPSKTKLSKDEVKKEKPKKHPGIRIGTLAVIGLLLILFTMYDLMLYGVNAFTYIIGTISIILVLIAIYKTIKLLFIKEKKK